MMMNCFYGMFGRRKAFTLISSQDHCQRPHHREPQTRGEQDNIANLKYWRRSSLIRNLLNGKHYAPFKSTYSKYHITKLLENCFQRMNCFSWIKLTPIWITTISHTQSFPANLTISVIFYPSQLKSHFTTILIMFFIGFLILS